MFTYGDGIGRVDIEALLALPPLPRPHRHRHRRPPQLPLRRDARRGRHGGRVQREADDARGLRQRRLLRLPARGLRLPDRRARADPRARAAAASSRATASSPSTATRTSGWAWTPTASSPSSNRLWASGEAPWKVWDGDRVAAVSAISDTFWAGRRVLVTGHSGFKGRWLSLWLRSLGAEVTGFSRRRSEDPEVRSIQGTVADHAAVLAAVDGGAARGRLPPGRPLDRAGRARGPGPDLLGQRDRHRQRAGRDPRRPATRAPSSA